MQVEQSGIMLQVKFGVKKLLVSDFRCIGCFLLF